MWLDLQVKCSSVETCFKRCLLLLGPETNMVRYIAAGGTLLGRIDGRKNFQASPLIPCMRVEKRKTRLGLLQ